MALACGMDAEEGGGDGVEGKCGMRARREKMAGDGAHAVLRRLAAAGVTCHFGECNGFFEGVGRMLESRLCLTTGRSVSRG